MSAESDSAVNALFESPDYVSTKASDTIAQSLFQDFQMLMFMSFFQAILSKIEDPEAFLTPIKDSWIQRSEAFLKSEAKRFQELILKSSATDGHKLPNDIQSIFVNYSNTLTTAYSKVSKSVDDLIDFLLNKSKSDQPEKETNND